MKTIVQLLFVCCFITSAFAQTKANHFIYIQSETKDPFFVLMNGKNYSSTINGYLILAKLQNGLYNLIIGFPKDKYQEQKFNCAIADNDLGFSLKQNSNKQWELFNLQDFTTVSTGQKATAAEPINVLPTISVAIDSTVTTKPSTKNISENNTANKAPSQQVLTAEKPLAEGGSVTLHPSSNTSIRPITIISSVLSETGIMQVYIDKNDTISVFIPNKEKLLNADTDTASVNNSPKVDKSVKNCTFATNDDFLKTRLQMAAATTEADMMYLAALAFKQKCFSVEQVKNLGVMILTEENRLTFFLAAKKTVYDAQNFASLQSLLSKPILIQQFRNALL